jgi:hypothetical protein
MSYTISFCIILKRLPVGTEPECTLANVVTIDVSNTIIPPVSLVEFALSLFDRPLLSFCRELALVSNTAKRKTFKHIYDTFQISITRNPFYIITIIINYINTFRCINEIYP